VTVDQLSEAVRAELAAKTPDQELFAILCRYKECGGSQEEARKALEALRASAGEDVEDRILELLDVVMGFCSPHQRIWEDN
jgi:hypothetical protein